MRLFPFPRRHRILWLIVAVLSVSACGSWLAATGRTPGYGSQFSTLPADETSAAIDTADSVLRFEPSAPAEKDPVRGEPDPAGPEPVPAVDLAGGSGTDSRAAGGFDGGRLAGMTDPLAFTSAVATTVFTSGPETDFDARVEAVMSVAALPPLGSPADLHADLGVFAPHPDGNSTSVSFTIDSVTASAWGSARINQLRLPDGTFAIDVTGHQLISVPGHDPESVTVTAGITGACPPALIQCELDRIFPRTIAAELGS